MDKNRSVSIKSILEKIDDLFTDEVGPVAMILCQEARKHWIQKVTKQNKKPCLRNLHIYVNQLAQAIEDSADKKHFIEQVYALDSLSILKSR